MLSKWSLRLAVSPEPAGGSAPRRSALEHALAEAEKHLALLRAELRADFEAAGHGSKTLAAAARDGQRFAEWLDAKIHDLRKALDALETDLNAARQALEHRVKDSPLAHSETLKGLRLDLEELKDRVKLARESRKEELEERPP